jgi:DNA polymerase-3 subunit epsilon
MTDAVYLVFDAETGGIDVNKDRIVQWFMATADKDGNLLEKWQFFINPGVPIADEAIAVHGLTNEWLADNGIDPGEAFTEIRLIFLENIDLIHVAFNMAFDLSILDAEFKRHGVTEGFGVYMRDTARLVDPIVIDRHEDKWRKGRRTLAAQAAHYGVPFDPDNLHDASVDVELTVKVTVKVLEKFGIPTTEEQAAWYAEWAEGFQRYLRRKDATATVDGNWPVKLKVD